MEPQEKMLSCVRILEFAVVEDASEHEIKALIKKSLGPSWSLVSAAQYLTGRTALEAFESLPSNFQSDGLNKLTIGLLIATAHEFCANALKHGPISNGVKVENFRNDSGLSELDRLASIFVEKKKIN